MIKNWFVTGDTHGATVSKLYNFDKQKYTPEETALIILGDVGVNYYLNEKDNFGKQKIEEQGIYVYCVRGNHEARPQDVPGMILEYDENVLGETYYQPEYPHIRYFKDFGKYQLGSYSVAVIGGAYSVDKYYRLMQDWQWFENEQLSDIEKQECLDLLAGKYYDFVFTHTCPFSWRPKDLFLGSIDQYTVDTSTEVFLETLKNQIQFGTWLFGHYHNDRLERPRVEMFFNDIENLNDIYLRWNDRENQKVPWYLDKGPDYYAKV